MCHGQRLAVASHFDKMLSRLTEHHILIMTQLVFKRRTASYLIWDFAFGKTSFIWVSFGLWIF